ncbi:RTC4-like domain-containing protein [Coprinopsis sp. MPI-PUGE-AT-0042]|nr:RTC4-like domain-containing protein [Coprinopsis sp. MPI-PUGE-AT-0042]
MESMRNKFSRQGTNLHNDKTLRLPTRTGGGTRGGDSQEGSKSQKLPSLTQNKNAFDVVETQFGGKRDKDDRSRLKKGKKPRDSFAKDASFDLSDESSDPLDSISEADSSSGTRRARAKKSKASSSQKKSDPTPEFKSLPKGLSFKKVKTTKAKENEIIEVDDSDSRPGSRKGSQNDTNIDYDSVPQSSPAKLKGSTTKSYGRNAKSSQNARPASPPAQTSRPRPRPVVKAPPKAQPFPFAVTQALDAKKKPAENKKNARNSNRIDSSTEGEDEDDPPASSSRRPAPFPMAMGPPSSQITSNPSSAERRSSVKSKPAPFPVPFSKDDHSSPMKEKSTKAVKKPSKKAPAGFPMSPPKRTFLAEGGEDEDEESEPKAVAQPFPMSRQSLASSSTLKASPHRKRQPASSDDDDEITPRKKARESLGSQLDRDEPFEEGDSLFISPDTDPKTLCPFCDMLLPSSPSPHLQNILAAAKRNSTSDPRPANPLGRKAPFTRYITVCQRHRFESTILPEAEEKGWPKTIDWSALRGRVENMHEELEDIIEDRGKDVDGGGVDDDDVQVVEEQEGARSRCVFWNELMGDVKKKGSRAAAGIKDQFLNFEKTQPGYYGELGSVIIHQTLYNMFPPTSFNLPSIAPLSPEEFIQRILVPEVALRLIMQDRRLVRKGAKGVQEALTVLRESSAYGVAMFPADVTEDGAEGGGVAVVGGKKSQRGRKMVEGLEAGERIVMERAMKRRKEIEAEEEEEERKQAEEAARMPKPKPKPRPVMKGSSKSSMMDVEITEEDEKWTEHRSSQSHHMEEDTDPVDDFECPPPANQEVRPGGRRPPGGDTDMGSDIEVDSRKGSLERSKTRSRSRASSRASSTRDVSPTVTEMNAVAASQDPRKRTTRSRASSKASSRAPSPKPVRTRKRAPSESEDPDSDSALDEFQSHLGLSGSKGKDGKDNEGRGSKAKGRPVRKSSDMETSSSSDDGCFITDMKTPKPKKKFQLGEKSREVLEGNNQTPRAHPPPAAQASGNTPPLQKWRAQIAGKNSQASSKSSMTNQRQGQKGLIAS